MWVHRVADYSQGYSIEAGVGSEIGVPQSPDQALLELLREGSGEAFEVLIERFQHPVYNLIVRLLGDPAEAADVVQEVFLKVFRKIGSFRGQSSLKTWIYRIAVNEASNHRRSSRRHRGREVEIEPVREETTITGQLLVDPCLSPYEQAASAEMRRQVEEALAQINPDFRAAVVLRDIDGLSYEEVAEVLDVSLGTVKSRILRGREALREALTARHGLFTMGRARRVGT
jgi:RNA polymerase sigma-70 factor (ECF subfamily)